MDYSISWVILVLKHQEKKISEIGAIYLGLNQD
jgi:hypothetical protein